jgi:hypothetical protein
LLLLELLTGAFRTDREAELLLTVFLEVLCVGLATDLFVLCAVLRTFLFVLLLTGFLTVVLLTVVERGVLVTCLLVTDLFVAPVPLR